MWQQESDRITVTFTLPMAKPLGGVTASDFLAVDGWPNIPRGYAVQSLAVGFVDLVGGDYEDVLVKPIVKARDKDVVTIPHSATQADILALVMTELQSAGRQSFEPPNNKLSPHFLSQSGWVKHIRLAMATTRSSL